ncbi:MAG: methionine--tRNA ligase subunit beta [Thermoproteota archaeon]
MGEGSSEARGQISIEEFARVELRVGRVVEAERIPGTRLLRLVVDLGGERRQVVSGIGDYYSPEDLLGRSVVVVANLRPKRIRGYLSEGMILAAGCEKGQRPVLVVVEEGAQPGWRVC